jgi:hypothetical protein
MELTSPQVWTRVTGRTVTEDAVGIALGGLALVIVTARALHLHEVPAIETFVLVFVSIVLEALPFILIGAVVSAFIAAYVSDRMFARASRLPLGVQLPCAAVGAFAFPVCDCGTVPVARRLIARGLHPAASLTFMLAAPIVNPLVLASTYVAYGGGRRGAEIAASRAGLALVVAATSGLVVGRRAVLRPSPDVPAERAHEPGRRVDAFATHVTTDFLYMGKFLVIGASLAALLQSVVPQSALTGLAGTPVLAALALMAFAFALSLCSVADAFVAASLGAFSIGPQLAFLVFGPIADAKLTTLYGATFQRPFVLRLIVVAVPVIAAGSLVAGRLLG